jgi:hypothetical protein
VGGPADNGWVNTCPAESTLTFIRSPARRRIAESALWLSTAQPCVVQLATAPSSRRRLSSGETELPPPRLASRMIRITSAAARIASSTHTHAGVSLLELDVELVEVELVGAMIRRVVVCSTVAVVRTVVGSDTVSVVVSVVVVTPAPSPVATRTPAIRQAASPASCSGLLTRATYTASRGNVRVGALHRRLD